MLHSIELFPIRGVLRASVPKVLWHVVAKIPIPSWKMVVDSDAKILKYVTRARDVILEKDARLKSGNADALPDEEDERVPMLQRLMRHAAKTRPEDRMTPADIISEGMGHTIAGVDTSSNVMSYALYLFGNRPDIVTKLRAELDPIMSKDEDGIRRHLPDISVLNKLPYLNAFVKELLRIYGAGPSLLERVVPQDFSIQGHAIPAGSIVATQAWSVHRDASIYPKPEEFIPERWFEQTDEMWTNLIPFGTGGRICGGMNVAHLMIRKTLSAIVTNFDIRIPPQTTPDSMEIRFAFVILPKAQKVDLVFDPRHD
ncbi:hypothetical protein FRC03_009533 [Tulasnella sp. 419]|nr:hypothetical protein FRC03_009533 [Tulasnella sp. 419]